MAKLCICRDFNDCQARDAIIKHNLSKAEDVHRTVSKSDPNCGICLSQTQALIDKYKETGIVPNVNDLTPDDVTKAHETLIDRFAQESGKERYKGLYRRIPIKAIEQYGAKVIGENIPAPVQ